MAKKQYELKKTLKKFGVISAEVILAGLAVYLTENNYLLVVVPVIEALRNFVKHYFFKK